MSTPYSTSSLPLELDRRLALLDEKLDKVIELLEPVHSHAEWVDRLRARFHNMGLMRNAPRVKVGEPEVGDPPRYLHVPYPVGETGDGKV
jgi:hypothetical protein